MMLGEVEDAVWGLVLRAWGFTLNLNIWTIVGAAPFSRAISTTPKTPQLYVTFTQSRCLYRTKKW